MIKSKREKRKSRRISSAVADAIISGDNWLEATQILQALAPVEDLIRSQIEGLEMILDDFRKVKGEILVEDTATGFDIVSRYKEVSWTYRFDKDGNKIDLIIRDATPKQSDADTLESVKKALQAAYEIPRREFALTELERIVAFIENDNALSGLDRVRKLLSDNENIVYSTVSAAGQEVDMSPIIGRE